MSREYDFSTGPHLWNRLGFVAVARPMFGPGTSFVDIAVPHWILAALLSILPIGFGFRLRRVRLARQRLSSGQCIACGYDVRASPHRCPECGTPRP